MNTSLIREHLHSYPRPFVFRLSDGTRVPVQHPDFVAVAPGLVVVIGRKGAVIHIDPLHVVAIEKSNRSKANGKAAR